MIEPRSVCPGGLRSLPELRQWDLVGPSGSDEIRVSPGSTSSTNGSTNGPQHSAAGFTEGTSLSGKEGSRNVGVYSKSLIQLSMHARREDNCGHSSGRGGWDKQKLRMDS